MDNGPADVRIDSYVADRLSLSIDAKRDTLVGTSIPRWRGWKLTIDGKPAPTIPFNHAFIAFVAPAGRHRAQLRYLPDGFLYGAGLTGSSLLLCAFLAARARRAHAAASVKSTGMGDKTRAADQEIQLVGFSGRSR